MFLLHTASFKEFGSLVCLWHDVKLRKTQLEVRSLNVTWRHDLLCHRVIVFWECVKLLVEQLWQIWRRYAPPFFRYLRKTSWGRITAPPGRARVIKGTCRARATRNYRHAYLLLHEAQGLAWVWWGLGSYSERWQGRITATRLCLGTAPRQIAASAPQAVVRLFFATHVVFATGQVPPEIDDR